MCYDAPMEKIDKYEYAFILGSHPEISFAELLAVLPQTDLKLQGPVAFMQTDEALDAVELMNKLGGTVKIVQMVGDFDEEALVDWLYDRINYETKFHFGFSMYSLGPVLKKNKNVETLLTLGLALKKQFRADDISARFVQSKDLALSSVIVHKERLLKNGVDVVILKDDHKLRFGYTLAVQPFQQFSKRDYGRPQRDARSGMLPPKLARMMLNLSQPTIKSAILDPFCGSGTVLQEALLMGYTHVIGSDKSGKAIEDTAANLKWLKFSNVELRKYAAERLVRDGIFKPHSIDRIVFEGYLGTPNPQAHDVADQTAELNRLYLHAFAEFVKLLKPGGRIVAALPFWHLRTGEKHLDVNHIIGAAGLKKVGESLLYRRDQSTVGREICIAEIDAAAISKKSKNDQSKSGEKV
ncbi:MAG: hypothetical protein CO132_02650 [Candidatus Kerfeldbacteria bacterium CG_4_9_14_3_um_filter_45_8]|nr:MAG: hypothetical protein CO132_02650 [Candidatus Kerfeldbacteria bacterium CG_4_9_14_3_um_filter_45_8]